MRRILLSHWQLKLVSFLLALALWGVVMREEKIVTLVPTPIELKEIPQEMVVVNDVDNLVSVKLRGPRSLLSDFVPSQIELLPGRGIARFRPGENTVRIDPAHITVPRGIEVLGVTPSSIRVVLERLASKELPIAPRLEGSPARGFLVRRVICTPTKVEVRGPERALREVRRIPTEPISVEGRKESFRRLAFLESPGNHITWKEEASRVSVSVEIVRKGEP
ncbi:MAG: CdaR family protein [candidate division NC10 bacterium]|nr:CdaR family protein [candidate division NC10 bacterium]